MAVPHNSNQPRLVHAALEPSLRLLLHGQPEHHSQISAERVVFLLLIGLRHVQLQPVQIGQNLLAQRHLRLPLHQDKRSPPQF